MAEIPFERLLLALEAVRGTAINPPTHYLNMAGSITPVRERYRPDESRGHLAEYNRSVTVRNSSEWEAEGPLDNFMLPVLLHMALDGVVTPTTPVGGTTARLWTFNPTLTTDDVKSATMYWGDPNVQEFQAPYCMIDEIGISADASGTDGAMMTASGMGQIMAKTAPSSAPAQLNSPLMVPADMQVWVDLASATIGTTALAGRVVSAEFSMSSGITYKWLAIGPGGSRTFSMIGRGKRHGELTLVVEMVDMAEYDRYAGNNGDTVYGVRWRLNGPIIEAALRHYVELDIFGPMESLSWGEHEGTNRTLELTIMSEYQTTPGYDLAIKVQNNRLTL